MYQNNKLTDSSTKLGINRLCPVAELSDVIDVRLINQRVQKTAGLIIVVKLMVYSDC